MAKMRFRSLDGMRGVCALSVLLFHCEWLFKPGAFFRHGYLAVDMFFLLSGFVIAASYDSRFAAGLTVPQFLTARIRRLGPVYWGGLALCWAGALLTTHWIAAPGPGQVTLWAAMEALLIPHLGSADFAYPINPVAWSLTWELIVNLAYAAWLRRLGDKALLVGVATLLAAAFAESLFNPRGWSFGMAGTDVWLGGLRAFPTFLMGVMMFRAFRAGRLECLPKLTPLLPLAAWLAIASIPHTPSVLDAALVILVCPLLLGLLLRNDGGSPSWFTSLGALSYPLYASHLAFVLLARTTPFFGLDRHPDPLRASLVFFLACAAAWGLQILFEPGGRAGLSGFFTGSPAGKTPSGPCLDGPDAL